MPDIELHRECNSRVESIKELFGRGEEGFFVSLYRHEYTWEEENINQLFDDLLLGIRELSNEDGDKATTFLGTAILTTLVDKQITVIDGEDRAQPTAVQLVIDGQQRISTIALLSIQLIEHLKPLKNCLPSEAPYKVLQDHYDDLLDNLPKLYSIKLGRGSDPPNKPKIIRAGEDRWTYDGDDSSYQSPVAHYIATYIRTKDANKAFDSVTEARVKKNIELIQQWLDQIRDAHVPDTPLYNQFPVGQKIATDRMQKYVLGFKDDDLKAIIEKVETNRDEKDYSAVAIYHLYLLAHYLLKRCGINCLQATQEEWGFDMFQALNTTGTPLTAMETFLPQIMQAEQQAGNDWMQTPSYESIEDIDRLFEETKSNEQKNRRTNDLFSTFALCYEGEKLGNKFSVQRRWMNQIYAQRLQSIEEKRDFLHKLAQVANFFHAAWHMEEVEKPHHIKGLEDHAEGECASFLVQYLKDANSRLSTPILARFYSQCVEQGSMDEFVKAAKACAAFFTLWRSASSTSGLDEIYRKFFRGSEGPVSVNKHSWVDHSEPISSNRLKQYFWEVLGHKEIDTEAAWLEASERGLLYTEVQKICRFVLFLAGHDRVADEDNPGLTTPGRMGVCSLLKLGSWKATDFKSIEHVAPKNPPSNHDWDHEIYSQNRVDKIGNLILLPININQQLCNKGWEVKFLHYSHVGVRSRIEIDRLENDANKKGIVLSKRATDSLSKVNYNCAVEPILKLGIEGAWDADLIDRRTQQIKEIAWKILKSWLKP